MGNCIICGTSVEGHVCSFHEEDVAFTFEGDDPSDLTQGRYYEGNVDGIADFGVFVNIGGSVTGLLHRSELDVRLESLDWEEGDEVFTQVLAIHDNGNVDLGWSIRQSADEFRGALIDTGESEELTDRQESEESVEAAIDRDAGDPTTPTTDSPTDVDSGEPSDSPTTPSPDSAPGHTDAGETVTVTTAESPATSSTTEQLPDRVAIADLEDRTGSRVTVEGRIIGVRQTSGPTIFTVQDETGVVQCAAFDGPGVRAYPDVDTSAIIRIFGEVEMRRGELQIETEDLQVLQDADAERVRDRLEDAVKARAEPDHVDPLAEHDPVQSIQDQVRDAAMAIRRAVIESRPIVVRHPATADGYVAGVAIERAVLPMLREEHDESDAEYRYFDRRPIKYDAYDMRAATNDVTSMLDDRARHDEKLPLVVLAGTGTTEESLDGLEFLDVYEVPRVILNAGPVDGTIADREDLILATDNLHTTSTVIAVAVAVRINPTIREDIAHLPAVSYWTEPPEGYRNLAREAGFDEDSARELREAVALEAYYQSYEDKRELIADLLFEREEEVRGLASHVSEQFRNKLETALRTARAHLEYYETGGVRLAILDTDAYTHRFDFPPKHLVIDALHRAELEETGGLLVTAGIGTSEAILRSNGNLAFDELIEALDTRIPEADVSGFRSPSGAKLRFLAGERDRVEPALIEEIAPAIAK